MDRTDIETFIGEIESLFHPEPDDDGIMPEEFPNERITDYHMLNVSYMESLEREGSSCHKYTRLCPTDEDQIHLLTRNKDVPSCLFGTALRLFADSIIEYHAKEKKVGGLRFYPPIILTFWAGFETFVRHSSQLLIQTVKTLPVEVRNFLSEEEKYIGDKGEIATRVKYYGILDRYAVFLKYAYHFDVDRGQSYWQQLTKAKKLRDYYTHLNVTAPRKLNSKEVLSFMEAILLSIIVPSCSLQRSLMLGVYWLYDIWTTLYKYNFTYTEEPGLIDMPLREEYCFHCNFENIDHDRFPSTQERLKKKGG